MVYTDFLGNGIKAVFEGLRKISGLAGELPAESRAGLEAAVDAVARDLGSLRAKGRELERLASFPILNPLPVVQVDIETGRPIFLNSAAERILPELRASDASHPWLQGLVEVVDELRRTGKPFVTRKVQLGERWFELDI